MIESKKKSFNKIYSNIILTAVLICLIIFLVYLRSESTKCVIDPCKYILDKTEKTTYTCGGLNYNYEFNKINLTESFK